VSSDGGLGAGADGGLGAGADGGSTADGGAERDGGVGGAAATASKGGCSCRVGEKAPDQSAGLLALALGLAAVGRRKRTRS
jgi:MYXO-CTERM domain-containing protein